MKNAKCKIKEEELLDRINKMYRIK